MAYERLNHLLAITACCSILMNLHMYLWSPSEGEGVRGIRELRSQPRPPAEPELQAIDRFMTARAWERLRGKIGEDAGTTIDTSWYSSSCRFSSEDGSWHVLIRQRNDPAVTHKVYDQGFIVKAALNVTDSYVFDHPLNSRLPLPESIKDEAVLFEGADFTPIPPEWGATDGGAPGR